jgi:hypothetical protein
VCFVAFFVRFKTKFFGMPMDQIKQNKHLSQAKRVDGRALAKAN